MTREGHIFGRLCSYQALAAAFAEVRRGKRMRRDVRAFEERLHDNLFGIREDLVHGTFRFGDYHYFMIHDPKERRIAAAPVRERVVHHAIIALCGVRLERALVDRSYACRVGKGQWAAVAEAKRLAGRYPWCLKLDMKSFFDSIDHNVLLTLLERKFKDADLLALLRQLIVSYETAPGKGLPIGNLTSQYFANLYLDPLDRLIDNFHVAGVGVAHVRYMDDLIVFGSHDALRALMVRVKDFLNGELKLSVKEKGGLHRIARGVDFLGTRIFPRRVRLARASKRRFLRKNAYLEAVYEAGLMTDLVYQRRLTQLFAFVRQCDTENFRRKAGLENGHWELSPRARRLLEYQQQQQRRRLCGVLSLRISEQQLQQQQRQQQHEPEQQQQLLGLPLGLPPCSSMEQVPHVNRSFSGSWVLPRQTTHTSPLVPVASVDRHNGDFLTLFKETFP